MDAVDMECVGVADIAGGEDATPCPARVTFFLYYN